LSSKNGLDSEGQDRPAHNNLAFTGSCQTFPGFAGIFMASPEELERFYERERQEKSFLLIWQPEFFLTASPAVLGVLVPWDAGTHCRLSQCEHLRA